MVFSNDNPFPPSIGSFQVPVIPPDVDPDDGDMTVVCFSTAWLPYIMGALQQLTLQASWQGDAAAILLTQQRAMDLLSRFNQGDLVCTDMMVIKDIRYDGDTDQVQRTFDGGSSWVDSPDLDPRHSPIFLYPPVDAVDPRCQAAANMVRFLNNVIDETLATIAIATTAADMVLVLMPLFIELGPFAILLDLGAALASTLLGAGAAAISAAFTNDVYDTLTCIFYCNISTDGSVSAVQLETIETAIAAQIGGLVSTVLDAMLFLTGEVGLSNEGTIGSAPADCSDCECSWCHEWTGSGLAMTWGYMGAALSYSIHLDPGSTFNVTRVEIDYTVSGGGEGGDSSIAFSPDSNYAHKVLFLSPLASSGTATWDGNISTGTEPTIWTNTNNTTGSTVAITRILMQGCASSPYVSNCTLPDCL